MTPQDFDMFIWLVCSVGLFGVAVQSCITYKLLLWYHDNLLMPALKMVASQQPSLRVLPSVVEQKEPQSKPVLRMGPAPVKSDDAQLGDLYEKLHGTI